MRCSIFVELKSQESVGFLKINFLFMTQELSRLKKTIIEVYVI